VGKKKKQQVGTNIGCQEKLLPNLPSLQESVIQAEAVFICRLAPGDYFISLGVATKHGEAVTPHDRRYDSIHLQVRPNNTFFGLANLELNLSAQQVRA
jgi:lipopolysaccharide transport system ATP-binding protein